MLCLTVLGPPGSGKSTLTRKILDHFPAMGHYGVRMRFAKEMKNNTDLGQQARPYAEQGLWLPDELVIEALRRSFASSEFAGGCVIEGMPGNSRQAALLDQMCAALDIRLDVVIYLEAPDDVCIERALRRRVCVQCDGGVNQVRLDQRDGSRCAVCGAPITTRMDDNEQAFRRRLAIHRETINQVISYYDRSRIICLDGLMPPDQLFHQTLEMLSLLSHS